METHSLDNLDEGTTAAMRSLYAAPAGVAYWDSLHDRIITGLRAENRSAPDSGWLTELARWATPGLAAAALLLAASAALWARLDQAESRSTYEGFTQPMIADAMPAAATLLDPSRDGGSQGDATLTYVLSH